MEERSLESMSADFPAMALPPVPRRESYGDDHVIAGSNIHRPHQGEAQPSSAQHIQRYEKVVFRAPSDRCLDRQQIPAKSAEGMLSLLCRTYHIE